MNTFYDDSDRKEANKLMQVKGNLFVNGSFRVGLMSVICITMYKCMNNTDISRHTVG